MVALPCSVELVCHPACRPGAVRGLRVSLDRTPDGALTIAYRLDGDPAALRLPASGAALPRARLWAHTCFELFAAQPGAPAYREFNFSPSGQWMRFDFTAYRALAPATEAPAPRLAVSRRADGLELEATLAAALLPAGELALALSTVVEHADGTLGYWALRHPAGPPDFHHREGFALVLPAHTP